ncbi:copper transporter [Nocardiopsis alba]|uniref:copper transporter n=1 Tax=Nocardiopsis alba TaxID=53437 RepID=UPI0033EB5D32
MIDFRYHLVSIVAVFLALTVGLVLGTTMLQDPLLNTLQSETADLRGQSEELRAERDSADRLNEGADRLADAVGDDVLEDRLRDVGLVVIGAPGADEDMVASLEERAEAAGADVQGRVSLEDAFVDDGGATFVDELALQVSLTPEDLTGGPYDKAGVELGRALAVGLDEETETPEAPEEGASEGPREEDVEESARPSDEGDSKGAEAVLAAFEEGGLISVRGNPARSADALLVVAPAGAPEGESEAANTLLTGFTTALSETVGPTVLAGGTEAAGEGGLIARALAEEAPYSTVDVAGRPTGDVVTVLALAGALEGTRGAYGIGEGVSGFLPEPLPGPIASEDPEDPEAEASSGEQDEARRSASGEEE